MPTTVTTQQPISTATILPAFPLPDGKPSITDSTRLLRKGQTVFDEQTLFDATYLVRSGEILIVRNGRPIDLVEADELLAATLWSGAIAIAMTDSLLEPMERPRAHPY
jgi:hypothetical protein